MTYTWSSPRWQPGQRVEVTNHRGSRRAGVIAFVETHYDHEGAAFHLYAVAIDGCQRRLHLGEEQIIRALAAEVRP